MSYGEVYIESDIFKMRETDDVVGVVMEDIRTDVQLKYKYFNQ